MTQTSHSGTAAHENDWHGWSFDGPNRVAGPLAHKRKDARARASWLVPGYSAAEILHHGRQAHLVLYKSRDHRKRYAVGQRLAVKDYIPGPTECHVRLTSVMGPAQAFTLGDVDFRIARELDAKNNVRLDDFRTRWVEFNDTLWWERTDDECETYADLEKRSLERFERRWKDKLAWLLRFELDLAAPPHLLAAQSDELYVENAAMALPNELPALRPAEWELHVGPRSAYREAERVRQQQRDRASKGWQERYATAKAAAKGKGSDIRDECRRFDRLMEQGKTEKAMRQLDLIEARVFPVAA